MSYSDQNDLTLFYMWEAHYSSGQDKIPAVCGKYKSLENYFESLSTTPLLYTYVTQGVITPPLSAAGFSKALILLTYQCIWNLSLCE